jgi:hypothetical protein
LTTEIKEGTAVRSTNDGQAGKLVQTDDGLMVRLDRAAQEIVVPYHPHAWLPAGRAALGTMQVAKIQYAADCAYREVHGEYRVADWLSLDDKARRTFADLGPNTDDQVRLLIYDALKELLK